MKKVLLFALIFFALFSGVFSQQSGMKYLVFTTKHQFTPINEK